MQYCTWYLHVLSARPGLHGNATSSTTNSSVMIIHNQGILYLPVRSKTQDVNWCTQFELSDKLAIHNFMHVRTHLLLYVLMYNSVLLLQGGFLVWNISKCLVSFDTKSLVEMDQVV